MTSAKKTEEKSETLESRRRTLRTLGIGTVVGSQALPEQWMKPVVSTIVMPAHAQTSPADSPEPSFECIFEFLELVGEGESTGELGFSAFVISEAANQGTPASFIVRNPGFNPAEGNNEFELEGSLADFVIPALTEGGEAAYFLENTNLGSEAEFSTTEITVDIDIDNNGEVDCSAEGQVSPPPP